MEKQNRKMVEMKKMKESEIKCTIVITAYNLEKYIAQALDSLLVQETNFGY